jgi:peptidyl-prolyl cis-trans isomerase SurA
MKFLFAILFFLGINFLPAQSLRNNQRTEEQAKVLVDTLYHRLMRGENFERLAILYSDDKSVERNNGEIGWTSAGVLVKEYEDMAASLKPMEISVPFKSQFGFHIVQLEEKEENRIKTRHILIAFAQ